MSTLLHTETFGQGKPVVLLHGWGMNSQIWPKALLQTFNISWTLIDLPGHGLSSHIPLTNNLDRVLDQIENVIPTDAIIIGWSLGGMFTLALMQRFAQSVHKPVPKQTYQEARGRRFGLISSSPLFVKKSDWPYATEENTLELFSKNLITNAKLTIKRFIALQFMNETNAKQQVIQIQKKVLGSTTLNEQSLLVGLHYLQTLDLRKNCQHLQQKGVGFYGKLDNLVPIKAQQNIESCFSAGQFTTITSEKSGHAPFLSDPELFKQFLLQVINQ